MNEWKNEELDPAPVGKPFLIFDGENIAVGRKSDISGDWYIDESYGWNEDGGIPKVYFWMELPPPPRLPDDVEGTATEIAGELE
jgi:hypothetical protein